MLGKPEDRWGGGGAGHSEEGEQGRGSRLRKRRQETTRQDRKRQGRGEQDMSEKNISKLEYNKYPNSSIDKIKDVNSDGFTDIQFVTERAGAGANIAYATYLFNKTDKMFEYSDVFSDYNIEYDSIKNRTSSFMKSGFGNYYYQFKNLNENRKDVEFVENVHHAADTIFYTKMVNEKIISEKKIVLKEYEDWKKYLERN